MLRIVYCAIDDKSVLQSGAFLFFVKQLLQKHNIDLKMCRDLPQAITNDMLLISDKRPENNIIYPYPVLGYQPRDGERLPYKYIFEDFGALDYSYLDMVYRRYHKLPLDILETERLKVREISIEDIDRLYEIYSEPSITEYMEGLYPEREKELEFIQSYIDNMYAFYGYGLWGVCEKESGRLIGRAGLGNRELNGKVELELGYIIAKDCQQKGYATEVCRAIIEYAKAERLAESVICLINPENVASKRTAIKLGFEYDCEVPLGKEKLELYVIYF